MMYLSVPIVMAYLLVALAVGYGLGVREQRRRALLRRRDELFAARLAEIMLPRTRRRPKVDARIQRRRYAR